MVTDSALLYGLGRVEMLAALINVLFMVLVVVVISVAAIIHFLEPVKINGEAITLVAIIRLCINIGVAWLLMHGDQTMSTRGALLHVIGDLLGSVAALFAGSVIVFPGWTPIDPVFSMLICALVLGSCLRLLREVVRAMLEGVPAHLSVEQIGRVLAAVPGVRSVHDRLIWTLSSNRIALSAHLVVEGFEQWPGVLAETKHVLTIASRDCARYSAAGIRCAYSAVVTGRRRRSKSSRGAQ